MKRNTTLQSIRLLVGLLFIATAAKSDAVTLIVSSVNDAHDVLPGDGICADAGGFCTLRAAVEEANVGGADSIVFAPEVGVIRLTFGALIITTTNLHLIGDSSRIQINGGLNPEGTDLIDVRGTGFHFGGIALAHSRRNGLMLRAKGARIGAPGLETSVIGNGAGDTSSAGVAIVGIDSADAVIVNLWIGATGNGTVIVPNQYGVRIRRSSGVTIGQAGLGNVISGNQRHGILIGENSRDVTIVSNCIGLDASYRHEAPNGGDGISISGATQVRIGGPTKAERNIISANSGNGISLSGIDTRDNVVAANLIGLDSSGFFDAGNRRAGISLIGGARCNRIGVDSTGDTPRLVVAGSHGNGIEIRGIGTDSNQVDWTYIGSDARGDADKPNGLESGQGIEISGGARHNLIGSEQAMPRNVIVGNYGPGITFAGLGTTDNTIIGNYVGVYRLGNSPFGNSAGVVVRDSAQHNFVGNATAGNLISANRGDLFPLGAGVVLFGAETKFNSVQHNQIGTDYTGTRILRNRSAGVIIGGGASHNLIGGDTAVGNQISGNGTAPVNRGLAGGVHIFGDGTDYNEVSGNQIGVAADQVTLLGNTGHGIGIFGGASHTIVGGESTDRRNIVVGNKYAGVWIEGESTSDNAVRYNSIHSNDSGGIVLVDSANGGLLPPTIVGASTDSVWGLAEEWAVVDLYSAKPGKLGRIQGGKWLGETVCTNLGTFACVIPGLAASDSITAVQTVAGEGSSGFSPLAVTAATAGSAENPDSPEEHSVLFQNQPNPFNSSTMIHYALATGDSPTIEIFNTSGQRVKRFDLPSQLRGEHYVAWDGTNDLGKPVASGTYFYRLSAGGKSQTEKMLLIK